MTTATIKACTISTKINFHAHMPAVCSVFAAKMKHTLTLSPIPTVTPLYTYMYSLHAFRELNLKPSLHDL
jgi:hypothetical protein